MAVQGDIIEITYNNPTIGSGTLEPKSNEGNTFDIGGVRYVDDANNITGSGKLILPANRVVGYVEAVVEDDAGQREDLLAMTNLVETSELTDFTVSLISGVTYAAKGVVVGDLQKDFNTGLFTVKIIAQGKWQKIAG